MCSFTNSPALGANALHFFTANAQECESLRNAGGFWIYQGVAFYARYPGADGRCPDGWLAVSRAFNNGFGRSEWNHRFTTSDSTYREMQRIGWSGEGTVMCVRP